MDAEHGSSDKRLRDSVSMVIRQLRVKGQPSRKEPEEIPESDEGEVDQGGNNVDSDDASSNDDQEQSDQDRSAHEHAESDDSDNEPPQRRNSLSSDDSSYHASNASEAEPASPNPIFVKAEAPHHPQRAQPRSPFSTVPPTPTHPNRFSSPLKRSRSRSISPSPPLHPSASGTASPSSPPAAPRPLKRHKAGAPLNHAYLALLNEDIRDAAARFVPPTTITGLPKSGTVDNNNSSNSGVNDLSPSQHGLTYWTPAEKALFFEALARVGRDDVPGIAARVRTKGVVECAAYLGLLKDAATATAGEGGGGTATAMAMAMVKGEKKGKDVERVVPAEIPAAVEVSVACCAALEEAADVVAAWQEGYEEAEERKRWGGGGGGGGGEGKDGYWLIDRGNWRAVEKAPPEGMASAGLFHVSNWLRLSERVFMNSAVEEYHWESVSEGRPAVRATALEDFYALAVEMTRRLVAATVFVAESRVKARKELYPDTRRRVWKQDVEAAALSLGLPTDSRKFWAKCARRLRLDVYDDENDDAGWDDAEGDQGFMSFEEVERALGLDTPETDVVRDEEEPSEEEEDEVEDHLTSGPRSDHGSVELGGATPYASEHEEAPPEHDGEEKDTIKREMDELLVHSALEYPDHAKAREALRSRIRAERIHEAYADTLDNRASYYEEKRLWEMLDRQPPVAMVKAEWPQEPQKLTRKTAGGMIQASARTPGDWRSKMEAVPSRWEMEFALVEEEKRQKVRAATGSESGGEN